MNEEIYMVTLVHKHNQSLFFINVDFFRGSIHTLLLTSYNIFARNKTLGETYPCRIAAFVFQYICVKA